MLRYLKGQMGHERVSQILEQAAADLCRVVVSAINWGELFYTATRQLGGQAAQDLTLTFSPARLMVIPVGTPEAERAAAIKVRYNFGYADCFGVQLTADIPGATLLTADLGVKSAEQQIHIEFLPPLPVE
jgi:predicted nucleic acid-binding protein